MLADVRPPLDPFFNLFGLPATVTPLGSGPVETIVIREHIRGDVQRATLGFGDAVVDVRPIYALRRDVITELPIGSQIRAPEIAGGVVKTWTVAALTPDNSLDPEVWHVIVNEGRL
jgi:hypothetical protein